MRIILLLMLITGPLLAQEHHDFAIYHDGNIGAWEDGVIAFEHFLDWKGVSHNRVTAQDINATILKNYYSAIYFPGGDADYYHADINSTGIQHIQNLISEGGAYIGMCAGAEFACDKLIWQDYVIDYPLNLFQGEAVGPIDALAIWPNNAMATLSMNLTDEINQYEPANEDMLYWGGTVFSAYENVHVDTVASYDGFFNRPAIIKFAYGTGRVLLISPHPEIEEDSDRDGVDVAEELNDNGSDWNFLWTATDWLLGNPLSEPDVSTINSQKTYKHHVTLYPNPAKNSLNLSLENRQDVKKLTIYNQIGQELFSTKTPPATIDLSQFQNGVYFIEIDIHNTKLRKKIIVLH